MKSEGDRGWGIADSRRERGRISECDAVAVPVEAMLVHQESLISHLGLSPIAYPPSPSVL